jgi:hypothetical protein
VLVGMRRGSGADEGKGEGRADGAGNGGMGSTASSRIHSSTTPDPPPQWRRDGAWVEAPAEWGAGGRVGEGGGDVGGPAGISAIVHLGAFSTLVATKSCPVATRAHSGCNLFTSGCN